LNTLVFFMDVKFAVQKSLLQKVSIVMCLHEWKEVILEPFLIIVFLVRRPDEACICWTIMILTTRSEEVLA
jgi:hypothetical protein